MFENIEVEKSSDKKMGQCEFCRNIVDTEVKLTFVQTKNSYICKMCHEIKKKFESKELPIYNWGEFKV